METLLRAAKEKENEIPATLKEQIVLEHTPLIRYIVNQYQESARARLEIGTVPLINRTLHFALRKDCPGAEEIVKRFNEQIEEMLADGTYNRILGLAWIEADVDGDGQSELVLQGDRAGLS